MSNFRNFSGATKYGLKDSNFGAFGEPMAPATKAYRSLNGSPWVLEYPYCDQTITQT
jgi:hypothetical protein